LLLDGKHTFVALGELANEYSTTVEEEDGDEGSAENMTDKKVWSTLLVEAFSEGVLVAASRGDYGCRLQLRLRPWMGIDGRRKVLRLRLWMGIECC